MTIRIPHRRTLLCTAISFALFPLASPAFAQDTQEEEIEEVIVTGSFIRRSEGFSQASSVTQINAEDLEDAGTLNMGEVIQNLSFVSGAASAITNTIQGTDSRSTSIDLRGLGASSTLTLLDGKRLVSENVNAMIPTIAIRRLDIVADGAAALYGNEAVAGVVNFIPYKSYDGLKVDLYGEADSRGDYDEQHAQIMWGGDIGDLDVLVAGEFLENSRLGWDERNKLANSGLGLSSNAPGNYYTPLRDANGIYTGSRVASVDPNCAPRSARTDYQVDVANNPFGAQLGNNCYFDFGDTRSYREPTIGTKLFANATWDVSDDLTLSLQGFRTRMHTTTYTSTSNPGNSRIGELPAIRGEIPGNPFRAVNANGASLFGVDSNGDGVPDRGSQDLNGDGTPDAIVSGITDNGIPLYEDVQARTLRPINKTHTQSDGHTADMDNIGGAMDHISRYSFQADFKVPYLEGWEGMAAYTYNSRHFKFMANQNYDITAMQQGLNCDVVNDRDACYNPFFVVDQANNNSIQVMNDIAARDRETNEDTLGVIDLVINGELPLGNYELPGGVIGMALGYQNREETYTNTPSAVELAGDTWIGGTEKEVVTSGDRKIDAYFVELAVPVLPSVEVELALRREEFSTGQSSTDPKYGITWAATDWLSLRATQGDAFIAPSLQQLLDPTTCGLSTVTDRFGPYSAFTTACGGGNPTLENETAQSRQLGFDLAFNDFDLSVTWNETDFQNRIIGINGQDLMELDFSNFKRATGFAGDGVTQEPSMAQLEAWLANPLSNKDIVRDPNDIFTILQVNNTSTTNAESVKVTAVDINSTYRFGFNNIGDFSINLQATYIDEFLYQNNPSEPITDGAGLYNDNTSAAPSLPKWKANLRMNWRNGPHSVSSTVHYVDAMPYDGPLFTHLDFFANTFRPGNIREVGVKAWTDMDISYTYRGLKLDGGEASLTLGSRNVFDRDAQNSPEFAGVLGALQDPMGRSIYGRVVFDF